MIIHAVSRQARLDTELCIDFSHYNVLFGCLDTELCIDFSHYNVLFGSDIRKIDHWADMYSYLLFIMFVHWIYGLFSIGQ